jgi:4-amino-4-deoxy-L-arabinose transferase-like glycosyltransferase
MRLLFVGIGTTGLFQNKPLQEHTLGMSRVKKNRKNTLMRKKSLRVLGGVSPPISWAGLVVIPLIVVLSVPPLVWFAHHWTVLGNDSARYLLAGSQLISGQGLTDLNSSVNINGGHGPVFPALIGFLILVFGRDTEDLAWAVRLIALVNPLLAYFLAKRISSPLAGLIAAALVTLFGYYVKNTFSLDAVVLTFYLLALLTLLAAIKRNSSLLALLSGVLLGTSILAKETALANLPLALLAVLLLDWNLRGALWHYVGVGLVCLPWWLWVWSIRGQVYLVDRLQVYVVDRLPVSYQVLLAMVAAIFLGFAAGAYASGMVARFLADERWRRWTGWFVVAAWTISLSGLLLATAAPALAKVSFEALRLYLAKLLAPSIIVLPVLVLVGGYVTWKAVRQNGPWKLLALALLFQVPVCLLVTVEGWALRQFLIPQTLLFCALAALVVAAGEAALQGGSYVGRLAGAVVAASLVILLLVSSIERARALLPENPGELSEQRRVAPHAAEMIDWTDKNIPKGKSILVTAGQASYLAFLDGGRHEWTQLRLDQDICVPRPNAQMECDPSKNAISRIPPDAVWVRMTGRCKVLSLSMSNLLEQVRRSGSGYVMISGSFLYPHIVELAPHLEDSNAFEVVHTELGQRGEAGANQGVVLLKSTGRAPEAVPTHMNANTVHSLRRCEQAKGPGYEKRMRSKFPNGILMVSD